MDDTVRLNRSLWIILLIYIVLAVGSGVQNILISGKPDIDGQLTRKYNNYLIFKYSHYNLIQGKDLYKRYPEKFSDLYKYSPSFALIFGILAYLPDSIGLNIWNLVNVLLLFFSILFFPRIDNRQKLFILIFVLVELLTSIQNSQSNGLIAGLLVLAFGLLERRKFFFATFCLIFVAYIKVFGIIALILVIFYPERWKMVFYSFLWFIILMVLPLFAVGYDQLMVLYKGWFALLATDHYGSYGLSVFGFVKAIFPSLNINKMIILLMGFIMLLLPISRIKQYQHFSFRSEAFCLLLIWIVIFNHKTESSTLVIAMTGIVIWYFTQVKRYENLVLLLLALIFTSLSATDLCPESIKSGFIEPYCINVLPCIIIWVKILVEMTFRKQHHLNRLDGSTVQR